jgi:plastocyanin
MMKRVAVFVLVAAVLVLAGCGSSSSSSSSSSGPTTTAASGPAANGASGGAIKVKMQDLAFTPDTVHAKVGQTVHWTNDDQPAHNVTYVSGPKFSSSSTISPGGTFSLKLSEAGTIHYVCTIHPFMKATIVVTQ